MEILAAIRSKRRARVLSENIAERIAVEVRQSFVEKSFQIAPSVQIRDLAGDLLARHPLSAADALQLAAFLSVGGGTFVCLDRRLRDAASSEGAAILPAEE